MPRYEVRRKDPDMGNKFNKGPWCVVAPNQKEARWKVAAPMLAHANDFEAKAIRVKSPKVKK